MAEAKPETKKPEKKAGEVSGRQQQPKETKPTWTLERVKRVARRFDSEDQWRACHPSSFKSALAHGWLKECLAEQGKPRPTLKPQKKAA